MDKDQTKELIFSFRIIIVGIFFWVFRTKLFTNIFLPSNNIFNIFDSQIIGTFLILIGVTIIRRIYPFAYTGISKFFIYMIFIYNLLSLMLYQNPLFNQLMQYNIFYQSIMLFFIAKLLQHGLKYFGAGDLSKKWKYFGVIVFFGLSIPVYAFVSLRICGFISFQSFSLSAKFILIFSPLFITVLIFLILYLRFLLQSFNFLSQLNQSKTQGSS